MTQVPSMVFDVLWRIDETVDEYGRRGALIGHFTNERLATDHGKRRGWYGGDVTPLKVHAIRGSDGQLYEVASTTPIYPDEDLVLKHAELVRSALAKLTPLERRALGLQPGDQE